MGRARIGDIELSGRVDRVRKEGTTCMLGCESGTWLRCRNGLSFAFAAFIRDVEEMGKRRGLHFVLATIILVASVVDFKYNCASSLNQISRIESSFPATPQLQALPLHGHIYQSQSTSDSESNHEILLYLAWPL